MLPASSQRGWDKGCPSQKKKHGVYGAFHHVSKEHLPRYGSEFEFRWNNSKVTDDERMSKAVAMPAGKRLTCRQTV
jgi:hypothetical protein